MAKKRTEKAKAFDKLVDTFQTYVRWRDGWRCICCNEYVDPYSDRAKADMHAGHYITRGNKTLIIDEINVNAQCKNCNAYSHWQDNNTYAVNMVAKYGQEILNELERRKRDLAPKRSLEEVKELTSEYRRKINELKVKFDLKEL